MVRTPGNRKGWEDKPKEKIEGFCVVKAGQHFHTSGTLGNQGHVPEVEESIKAWYLGAGWSVATHFCQSEKTHASKGGPCPVSISNVCISDHLQNHDLFANGGIISTGSWKSA